MAKYLYIFLLFTVFAWAEELNPFDQGERYYSQAKFSLAKDKLLKSLEQKPMNATAHFYLGVIGMLKKDFTFADHHLEKAIEIDPSKYMYPYNYAWSKFLQNKWLDSEIYFKKAESISPNEWKIAESKSQMYFKQFLFKECADNLEKVLSLRPNHPDYTTIEKLISLLNERAPDALAMREKLINNGEPLDANKYVDVFSIDLANVTREVELQSRSADKIDDFDVEIEAVE